MNERFITHNTEIDPISPDDIIALMNITSDITNLPSKKEFIKMYDNTGISIRKIHLFYDWLKIDNGEDFIEYVENMDIEYFDEHISPVIRDKDLKIKLSEKKRIDEDIQILLEEKKIKSVNKKIQRKKMEIEIIRNRLITIAAEHYLKYYDLRPSPVKWNTEPPLEWLIEHDEIYDQYFGNGDEKSIYYINDFQEFDRKLFLRMKHIHHIRNDHNGIFYHQNKQNGA